MHILRLNKAGQPIDWLTWQDAVCLYSRDLVCWSLGDIIYRVRGGYNRITGGANSDRTAQHYCLWRTKTGLSEK